MISLGTKQRNTQFHNAIRLQSTRYHNLYFLLLIALTKLSLNHGIELLHGQCPLRVPSSLSTTSPAELFLLEHNNNNNDKSMYDESIPEENEFNKRPPLLTVAHGGSSFHIPPHTLPSYKLAMELNTDYIQTHVVSTSDGILVASSSIDLNHTTNVQEVFPDRYRTDVVRDEMNAITGYFVHDFTLEEIQTLRVKRSTYKGSGTGAGSGTSIQSDYFDGIFSIPKLTDIFDLVHDWNTNIRFEMERPTTITTPDANGNMTTLEHYRGKRVGISIELKLPRWISEDTNNNISTPDLLLDVLKNYEHAQHMFFGVIPENGSEDGTVDGTMTTNFGCERYNHYQVPPLVIECFSSDALRDLHAKMSTMKDDFNDALPPFMYLVSSKLCKEETFWFHSIVADGFTSIITGISVDKTCLVGAPQSTYLDSSSSTTTGSGSVGEGGQSLFHDKEKSLLFGKDFMFRAEEHKLVIHAWTQKYEISSVSISENFYSSEDELRYLYCVLGINGIVSDTVDISIRVGIRGCDDFKTPEEFIKDEIEIEEEIGEDVDNSTIAKRICQSAEKVPPGNVGVVAGVMSGIFGLVVGGIVSFWMTIHYYVKRSRIHHGSEDQARGVGVQSIPTNGNDISRHLPEIEML